MESLDNDNPEIPYIPELPSPKASSDANTGQLKVNLSMGTSGINQSNRLAPHSSTLNKSSMVKPESKPSESSF